MRFDPLDLFKVIPFVITGVAFEGIGHLINPIVYTEQQQNIFFYGGAIGGGLYSVFLLGGFARVGNVKSLFRWSIPLALMWAMDAQVVRDKVIDITVNPRYTQYKKEFLLIPKSKDASGIESRLASINGEIEMEEVRARVANEETVSKLLREAKEIYMSNYNTYGWWIKKSHAVGCNTNGGLGNNQLERQRRIRCIANANSINSLDKTLNILRAKREALKMKLNTIHKKNFRDLNIENKLRLKISEISSSHIPIFAYYVILFFFGIFVESIIPHLKYWLKIINHWAKSDNKTVGAFVAIEDKKRRKDLINAFDTVLSTKENMIFFIQKHLSSEQKINAKINTFFAVIFAIKAGEEKITFETVQKYSMFKNPRTKKPFSTKNHVAKTTKLIKNIDDWEESEMGDILKKLIHN